MNSNFSIGVGDSIGDISLLKMVDYAFVYESGHYPDMIAYAKEQGWHTFKHSEQIIGILKKFL